MDPDHIRLAVRMFVKGALLSQEELTIAAKDIDSRLPALAQRHAEAMALLDAPGMVEIEFLDEPDPLQRYFRIGTDPAGMVMPIEIGILPDRTVQ